MHSDITTHSYLVYERRY